MKLDMRTINSLIGVEESFQAPSKLKEIVFNKEKREKLFLKFLEIEHDLSYDWFNQYFMEVQADRKEKKQDFTPASIAEIVTQLVGASENYFEPAAGTGGMLIKQWDYERKLETPLTYRPSKHFYEVEELGEASMPFLLFNSLIRGMNVAVIHGDSLSRRVKNIYFVQNFNDDFMKFSSLNVLPRTDFVKKEFNVSEWVGKPVEHVENQSYPRWMKVVKKIK